MGLSSCHGTPLGSGHVHRKAVRSRYTAKGQNCKPERSTEESAVTTVVTQCPEHHYGVTGRVRPVGLGHEPSLLWPHKRLRTSAYRPRCHRPSKAEAVASQAL